MPLPSMLRSLLLIAACATGLGQAASPAYPPASVQFTVHPPAPSVNAPASSNSTSPIPWHRNPNPGNREFPAVWGTPPGGVAASLAPV